MLQRFDLCKCYNGMVGGLDKDGLSLCTNATHSNSGTRQCPFLSLPFSFTTTSLTATSHIDYRLLMCPSQGDVDLT
jgi:hypothetical protein